jgi:RNA polymerase sigma-70 factor (ECF subfamily)
MDQEQHMLSLIKKKPKVAFNGIVDVYTEKLYVIIRKIVGNHEDADDALQNTFIKVWKNLSTFKGESQLYSWLYRIAHNEALALIRKRKAMSYSEQALFKQMAHSFIDHEQTIEKLELAIAALPQKQKQVFELRYYHDLPFKKMSEELETSVGALKASYHHAVKKIEKIILEA